MRHFILIMAFASTMVGAYAQPASVEGMVKEEFLKVFSNENVSSGLFLLHSDSLNLHIEYSESTSSSSKISTDAPFYLASITKTMTATAVMQLAEQNLIDLKAPLASYLSPQIMDSLHIYGGVDYSNQVTIHHLLSHTSGLPDYFEDKAKLGSNMMAEIFQNASTFWEPLQIITFTKSRFDSHFAPGQGYHYSDTGYLLLGMLIEQITGKPLHDAFSDLIFNPLGMDHTYMNLRSKAKNTDIKKMAPISAEGFDISNFRSLSADWGGGGVVSTLDDLLVFFRVLQEHTLISESSLNKMRQWRNESVGTYYGYGMRKWSLKEIGATESHIAMVGHSGSTGAFMYYSPELDTYILGSFNETSATRPSVVFIASVFNLLINQ